MRWGQIQLGIEILIITITGCSHGGGGIAPTHPRLLFSQERHFQGVRQLTHGGVQMESRWSNDGQWLVFLREQPCDQIEMMRSDGSDVRRISNGKGLASSPSFTPKDIRVVYASTFAADPRCPTVHERDPIATWPIFDSFQIYTARPDGGDILPLEPGAPQVYQAEPTVCRDGTVVFTSRRTGDLNLYRGELDRLGALNNVRQITNMIGYNGGAAFSPDCRMIAWEATRPKAGDETRIYRAELKRNLVKSQNVEIWTAGSDGRQPHPVTHLGALSFSPTFTPDGKKIVFASNLHALHRLEFELYMVNLDGSELERLTYSGGFNAFPAFSPDGKSLTFSSTRNATQSAEMNIFVANWVDAPPVPVFVRSP